MDRKKTGYVVLFIILMVVGGLLTVSVMNYELKQKQAFFNTCVDKYGVDNFVVYRYPYDLDAPMTTEQSYIDAPKWNYSVIEGLYCLKMET